MNWIPQLLAISNGDLTTPEVAQHARNLWKNTLSDPYIVDKDISFSSIELLVRHLHVGRETVADLMAQADAKKRNSLNLKAIPFA
ncbi:hypothetical protein EFL69_06580 [Weissella confusa]|uniref:hypothetical protein n=1 Tax=Weissella confusa TaxID=1583 RepID=UPI00223C1B78|nr:hypothetical protein [Weissella confusa]MCS9992745.1 hypothetical protein [Weissella confusa]